MTNQPAEQAEPEQPPTDYGALFSDETGMLTISDEVSRITQRIPTRASASRRSTPGIFDPAITQRPCRWPCTLHTHADDSASNRHHRAAYPSWDRPFLQSDPSEIPD